jgi:transglutaminase-like putative cysteine protease
MAWGLLPPGRMRRLCVGVLLLWAIGARAETPRPDYRDLHQRGALRGEPPLSRYRDQLRHVQSGRRGRSRPEIKPSGPIYQDAIQVGGRVTLTYGESGAQIDFKARVLAVDEKAGRVKVRALGRTAQGIRKTERWVDIGDLVTANVTERWPDGTRVLSGPPSDSLMASMVIDRRHDPELRRFLADEVKPIGAKLGHDPLAVVDGVAKLVADKIRYNMDTDADVNGREVLVGDYLRAGVGVCRNYAAITKVALDELAIPGLEVRYVSGQARDRHAFERGRHAWLEVTLPTGKRYGLDPTWSTWMTPLARFYADHLHVPLYQLRALHLPDSHLPDSHLPDSHLPDSPAPTVPKDAAPTLLTRSEDRTVGFQSNGFVAPGRARTAGWRLPQGGIVPGRKFVHRFAADPLAIDATAEILDVDERGGRVKIRASERGKKLERDKTGKVEETGHTKRTDRWVPVDGVRASLEVVDGAAFTAGGLAVDRARDPALDDFLKTEIEPIAASTATTPKKIARALGRVRMRLGQKEIDPAASHARLGDVLAAPKIARKPFAAAGLAAIQALAIPGLEVRHVAGTRIDRDLMPHGPGEWLEVEWVDKGQRARLGVDTDTGRVESLERFYALHRYAPRYEEVRISR